MNTKGILTNRQIRKMLFAVVTACISVTTVTAQTYTSGKHVEPAFEGWRPNPDGSFNMMFGYMNENWEETPDVAVGEENFFSPGDADGDSQLIFYHVATVSLLRFYSPFRLG